MKLFRTMIMTLILLLTAVSVVNAEETAVPTLYGIDTADEIEELVVTPVLISEPVPVLISEVPTLYNDKFTNYEITFKDTVIEFDTQPQLIEGKVMLPLRFIAETLGYEVTWNNASKQVDLMKGPHFTSISIGKNSYFKNKMAPRELSIAPTIVDGRTLVPVEFVSEIMGYGVEFSDDGLKIFDEAFTTLTGYVSEINVLLNYTMVTVAPRLGDDVEMWESTILIVTDNTIINRDPLAVGDIINGVHMPVMTMSIPAQTQAVVIY